MSHARTLWEEGRHPAVVVVAWAAAATLLVLVLDVVVRDRVSVVFDLAFVVVVVAAALGVRPRDFFVIGVVPPLLMLSAFVLVALVQPTALAAPGVGPVQTVVSGLARHSVALGVGYALCLAVLAIRARLRTARGHPRRRAAPPEHRPTSR